MADKKHSNWRFWLFLFGLLLVINIGVKECSKVANGGSEAIRYEPTAALAASQKPSGMNTVSYTSAFLDAELSRNEGKGDNLRPLAQFERLRFADGVSLDVPKAWTILSDRTVQLIVDLGDVAGEAIGMEPVGEGRVVLLKANAAKTKTPALLSLSTGKIPGSVQQAIASATEQDLASMNGELRPMFEKMGRAQGFEIVAWYGPHLERFGPYPAIVTEYEREGLNAPGGVLVQVNAIFTPTQEVRLMMSYRKSEGVIWRPILTRVRRSLVIDESLPRGGATSGQESMIEVAQKEVANQFRSKVPVHIDEAITLQNVTATGTTLNYHYMINMKYDDIDLKEFAEIMRVRLRHVVCGNSNMSEVLKMGGEYNYAYNSVDGLILGEFKYTNKECGN